jgi:hypothetical protein
MVEKLNLAKGVGAEMNPATIGVIGTLAGTALGAVAAYVTQWQQWARHSSQRWDEHRKDVYADFIAACDELVPNTRMARRPSERASSPTQPDLINSWQRRSGRCADRWNYSAERR